MGQVASSTLPDEENGSTMPLLMRTAEAQTQSLV